MLTVIVILFVLALIICRKKNLRRGRHSSFNFDDDSFWGSHHDFTDGGGDGDGD